MPTALETFQKQVIDPFEFNGLSYAEYLRLPNDQRAGHEAAVVDMKFTRKLLEWLGFGDAEIVYNVFFKAGNKPDFRVDVFGSPAFLVEDKSTVEAFDQASIDQIRRYTAGTSGYCIWTNAKTILGLQFEPNGQYKTLVEVRVDGEFGSQKSLFSQEANFEILYFLFNKERFTGLSSLIADIAVDKDNWNPISLTSDEALRSFISESRFVLDQLVTDVQARLGSVAIEMDEAVKEANTSKQKFINLSKELVDKLKGGGGVDINEVNRLEAGLDQLSSVLLETDISQIELLKPPMTSTTEVIWKMYTQSMDVVISTMRERELARSEARRIRSAYLVWCGRYKIIEGDVDEKDVSVEQKRQMAFAEQVSYVFFVRLLLARVLEDKGIMPRLVSDGGFSAWHNFLKLYDTENLNEIRGSSFLPLVYRRVAGFYKHFFQQPVFDWFLPDDYLVVLILHHLNKYNFKKVTSDILGFTYEYFIDRVARNSKGHFLTPPSVVDFMLDNIGYSGPHIIGENLLDPACGSGSFLVHCARRLRQALSTAMSNNDPTELAEKFIEQATTKLVGLEINPFSCYLAELNLFIQLLDDIDLLWKSGKKPSIERFSIYNTNSLEMPQSVLYSRRGSISSTLVNDEISLDDAAYIKAMHEGFARVVSNPPYVNRGIILGARSYGDFPFYQDVVKGDENFYLLFLRLADYYITPGGTACFICPLNLVGDESTTRARAIFSGKDWTIKSISRFYARNILFEGVLQGVCVYNFEKNPFDGSALVEIRGGNNVEEAQEKSTKVSLSKVVHNYPTKSTWNSPWLVNASLQTYNLWEFVRNNTEQDLSELIKGKIECSKGDVRSTWVKPMLVNGPANNAIPLTKGKNVVDWGPWSASSYIDPSVKIASGIKNYTGSQWVYKQVQRIANLKHTETVLFLKEVSGLEMKRPIRGTLVQRDSRDAVIADETLLVLRTLEEIHTDFAYATFGLLTSATYNFLFSIFSTNAHVSLKEVLRLPTPIWSEDLENNLAQATKQTLNAYSALYDFELRFGSEIGTIINNIMVSANFPTLSLEELVLRGDLTINGSANHSLESSLSKGKLQFKSELGEEAVSAIEQVIHANPSLSYAKGGRSLRVPHPKSARLLLSRIDTIVTNRGDKLREAVENKQYLDDMVLKAYHLEKDEWQQEVLKGVPWAKN